MPNSFFCSEWVATILRDSGINIFDKKPKDVRPFDFYGALKDYIIYEGSTTQYPEYNQENQHQETALQKIKTTTISKDIKI